MSTGTHEPGAPSTTTTTQPPAGTDRGNGIPGRPGAPGEEFFSRIRALGIVRPDRGRWAAGVARGLAHRWGVDPILVRGGFVALTLIGGAGLLIYGLGWLFLPHPDGRIHAQEVLLGRVTPGFVAAVLVTLGNISTGVEPFGFGTGSGWQPFGTNLVSLVVVGLVVWWFVAHRDRLPWTTSGPTAYTAEPFTSRPYPPDPDAGGPYRSSPVPYTRPVASGRSIRDLPAPSSAITRATLGLATVLGVAMVLYDGHAHLATYSWVAGAAVALGVVGVGLVVAGLTGRRGGGLAPIAVLLALLSLNGTALHAGLGTGGQRQWKPTTATVAAAGYQLGAGQAVLDLTDPSLTSSGSSAAGTSISSGLGAGRLQIVLPPGASIRIDAEVGLGEIRDTTRTGDDPSGLVRSGAGTTLTHPGGPSPVLVVKAQVGLGQIVILPQGSPEVAK